MSGYDRVALRIEKIREIFQRAQFIFTEQYDLEMLSEQLENTENEFRSIAYECASMALALRDFSAGSTLRNWRLFMEGPGATHAAQVHAGLGWAIAQQRISAFPIIETLDPLMRFRVLDGCGFYNGIFRQRLTIGMHTIPQDFENKYLQGYDQGVGRSLWYICKGECAKIPGMISGFSSSRHADLWRGVGVACAYVGGCDEKMLRELLSYSLNYNIQLSISAALVSRARNDANTLTGDTELACRVWCNLSAKDAMLMTVNTEPSTVLHPDDAYSTWLSNMEEELMCAKTSET